MVSERTGGKLSVQRLRQANAPMTPLKFIYRLRSIAYPAA
jgi:hypothetical protein